MRSEIKEFLKTKKKSFGNCVCCGRIVSAQLIGENYLHWYCSGEEKITPCINFGMPHSESICPFKDNGNFQYKRELYQEFIRKTLIYLMGKFKCANFIEDNEVLKAIKDILGEVEIYQSDIAGENIITIYWKILRCFDVDYPEWNNYEQRTLGMVKVDVDSIVGGNITRRYMYNADFSISEEYKNEMRYLNLLEGIKSRGIKNFQKTLESFAANSPISLFCFNENDEREFYVVADGHRRVSIAKQFGIKKIMAEVCELIVK